MPTPYSPRIQEGIDLLNKEGTPLPPRLGSLGLLGNIRRSMDEKRGAELYGITNPLTGSVGLNERVLNQKSPQDVAGTIVHEGAHAKQVQRQGLMRALAELVGYDPEGEHSLPYGQKPNELEAFQAENDRALKLGLPGPTGHPTFEAEGTRWRGDIPLRTPYKPPATPRDQVMKLLQSRR